MLTHLLELLPAVLLGALNLLANDPSHGLCLFTSRRHLLALVDAVESSLDRPELRQALRTSIFTQSAGTPTSRLVESYRKKLDEGGPAVLFGTGAFWEGIDLSGEHGLRLLVIPRLPFPSAGEPLNKARCRDVELRNPGAGGGAFRHFLLPQTLIRWRQGIGRLVRNADSIGVVVCLDTRASLSNYAYAFRQALPAGPGGPPVSLRCDSSEEMLRAWAEFVGVEEARHLTITDRPWSLATAHVRPIDPGQTPEEQLTTLDEVARGMVGPHYGRQEWQLRAMAAFAAGKDVLLSVSTGGGKTLCYQVPALVSEGLTVVISPLRALIDDQLDGLKRRKVPVPDQAACLLGGDGESQRRERAGVRHLLERHHLKLLYVTPEMAGLDVTFFERYSVRRVVFDEAHCLLSWGASFRPDYLRLAQRIRDWRKRAREKPAILACSATLTPADQAALHERLGLDDCQVIRDAIDRPNLYWGVDFVEAGWDDRDRRMLEILATLPRGSQAIIYTTYARTADEVASGLVSAGYSAAAFYAKKLKAELSQILARFQNGGEDLQIIVATKAFGMGIDNPRVERVIHYNHPENLTEYYQQAGRAGRDRSRQAVALTLYDSRDRGQHEFLHERSRLEEPLLRAVLGTIPRTGGVIEERELLRRLGASSKEAAWEASRVLRLALELLSRGGHLAFHEVIGTTRLVPGWFACDDATELPDNFAAESRALAIDWLDRLRSSGEYLYEPKRGMPLDRCLAVEELLAAGMAGELWRVVWTERAFWVEPGKATPESLSRLLDGEQRSFDKSLGQMVAFLENDLACRRRRLVATFDPAERVESDDCCCDVCQFRRGLGHPVIASPLPIRALRGLRTAEQEFFAILDENTLREDEFVRRAIVRLKGSVLAHEVRLKRYLEKLTLAGFCASHSGVWGLTPLGRERLEEGDLPRAGRVDQEGIRA